MKAVQQTDISSNNPKSFQRIFSPSTRAYRCSYCCSVLYVTVNSCPNGRSLVVENREMYP